MRKIAKLLRANPTVSLEDLQRSERILRQSQTARDPVSYWLGIARKLSCGEPLHQTKATQQDGAKDESFSAFEDGQQASFDD